MVQRFIEPNAKHHHVLVRHYVRNEDPVALLQARECEDADFLTKVVNRAVVTLMKKSGGENKVRTFLNHLDNLPEPHKRTAIVAAWKCIGQKFVAYPDLIAKTFNQIAQYDTTWEQAQVLAFWFQKRHHALCDQYLTQCPKPKEVEITMVKMLFNQAFPLEAFKFLEHIHNNSWEEVAQAYMLGHYPRSPDLALQEIERLLTPSLSPHVKDFTQALLERFENHHTFVKWDALVKSRYERVTTTLQRITLEQSVARNDDPPSIHPVRKI